MATFLVGLTFQKVKQSSSSECSTVDIVLSEEEMVYEREKPKHLRNGKKNINYFNHYVNINCGVGEDS